MDRGLPTGEGRQGAAEALQAGRHRLSHGIGMTHANKALRDVYRPTMLREALVEGNKGEEVIMVRVDFSPAPPEPPEPERTPITIVIDARWADVGNVYVVGSTVFAETAGFTGGLTDTTTYRWRIQTRADVEDSWTNGSWSSYTDHGEEVSFPLTATGEVRFQCQARDTGVDPVEQINSFSHSKTVTKPSTLVYSSPVVTGEPWVGQALTCSEPIVSGGIGPYQFDYFWVDETNVIVWEAPKMSPTTIVTTYDIGKMMKCLVQITDKGWSGGESITVESNSIGPIGQRTIGNVIFLVDGNVVATNGSTVNPVATMNGSEHIIMISPDGDSTNLAYEFDVRSGEARIQQTANTALLTIQGVAPGSVSVQCNVKDINTVEQQLGERLMFVIGE